MQMVEKHDFPAIYASYLINDDPSSLTNNEITDANSIVKNLAKHNVHIVSCEEEEKTGWWSFNGERELFCTMLTYICHRPTK